MNTRFNPTTNGSLHLGHIYMILVNEYEAHHSKGKFIIRFDDNQPYWEVRIGHQKMEEYACQIKKEIEYLEIPVDEWTYQSQLQASTDREILWRNKGPLPVHRLEEGMPICTIRDLGCEAYPYLPWLTAEKVIQDYHDQIRLLIRGKDIATEDSLYNYFCEIWDLPLFNHEYLDRLVCGDSNLTSISKTEGNFKIEDFMKHFISPKFIKDVLGSWCKIDTEGPWSIDNMQRHPRIGDGLN